MCRIFGQKKLSGPDDFSLLRGRDAFFRTSKAAVATQANFNKSKRVVIEGDQIQFASLGSKVSRNDLHALSHQVIGSGALRVIS